MEPHAVAVAVAVAAADAPEDNWDAFQIARALAIDAYTDVEESLRKLFTHLLQADDAAAAIVFYKIGSGQRKRAFEELWSLRYLKRFQAYLKTLYKELEELDKSRNFLVHAHIVNVQDGDRFRIELKKPAFWATWAEHNMRIGDLKHFLIRCRFFSRSLNMLVLFLEQDKLKQPIERHEDWREIFGEKFSFPPDKGHPLFALLEDLA